jgi:hypothetical protein
VGVFAKVMLALAILVANGVLLFVILRFLLWLAFPGPQDEEEAAVAARPVGRAALAAPAEPGDAAPVAAAVATVPVAPEPSTSPPTTGMPVLPMVGAGRPRAYPHRLLIGLPVILALFAGGVWLGSVVGGSGAAAAATRTIHVTGTVTTINSKTVVRVPATNVRVKGSIVSVPETTVRLPALVKTEVIKHTIVKVRRLPGKTKTVTATVQIPTTVVAPGTTVTSIETVTETVTSDTTTTSSSPTT